VAHCIKDAMLNSQWPSSSWGLYVFERHSGPLVVPSDGHSFYWRALNNAPPFTDSALFDFMDDLL
jgi:hypothetical protein